MDEDATSHETLVSGVVEIPAGITLSAEAILHVYLEEVTYADAPATPIAEVQVGGSGRGPGPGATGDHAPRVTSVPFAIRAHPSVVIDPRRDYGVRVWLDADGDGRVGPGDLYSDRVCRVLTGGAGRDVTIHLPEPRPRERK